MEHSRITESIHIARKNWNDWQDVFEHGDAICNNPLLINSARFASFLTEYRVSRTIRSGEHENFRRSLVESRKQQFLEAISDDTGHALDKLEGILRADFGTHEPKRRIVSAVSKVAAFVRPERFAAWAYAKKGVNIILGRAGSYQFNTYADYLTMFDEAWNGQPGQEIRDHVARNAAVREVERQTRFLRRVLDVYLMKSGGRKM